MSDYSAMKATKRKKKYSYEKDLEFAAKHPRKKYSYEKDLERAAKAGMKKSGLAVAVVVIFLILGVVGGFFGIKYAFRNDTFSMISYENGLDDITVGANEDVKEYVELGATCISFGKDCTDEIIVKYYYRADLSEDKVEVSEVDETKAGMYYAVYTTTATRYKTIELIRNITVTGAES